MHKLLSSRFIVLGLFCLAAGGCAHKRLIEAGEDLNRQGRIELAVEKYKQALEIEPNDRETRQNLEMAQAQLDDWLDDIHRQAQNAEQRGLNGRALLLYGKVAQLRRDLNAHDSYKRLRSDISENAYYKLALQIPKGLNNNVARHIKNVRLIDKASGNANEFSAKITFTPAKHARQSSKKEVVEQYVSGTETVTNPDYIALQAAIREDRDTIREYEDKISGQRQVLERQREKLTSVRKDREIAQLRLDDTTEGSGQYYHWRNQVNLLNAEVTKQQNRVNQEQSELDKLIARQNEYNQALDSHLEELSYLPPTVEQPVYSDYAFEVKQISAVASGNLNLSFKNGPTKNKTVKVKVSDETHQEHPLIELDHNPLKLPNNSQMAAKYRQQVVKDAESLITSHAGDYRQQLKGDADRQNGIDQQLEAFVRYGLAGDDGVDEQSGRRMRRILEQEFGITGEFDINRLLNLYR